MEKRTAFSCKVSRSKGAGKLIRLKAVVKATILALMSPVVMDMSEVCLNLRQMFGRYLSNSSLDTPLMLKESEERQLKM